MSEYRPIKTKIWRDNWFLSLKPDEKLLWLFLLTNEFVHISGLYELPKTLISPLVGVENSAKILDKFQKDGKIRIFGGWIFIKNYLKHQTKQINKKDNIFKSVKIWTDENADILAKMGIDIQAPYKPLISPLPDPPESIKEESIKVVKRETDISGRFAPPSLTDIQKYIDERPIKINADQFYNFYASKGWMVGRNKMKDWKACIRTWEQRETPKASDDDYIEKLKANYKQQKYGD